MQLLCNLSKEDQQAATLPAVDHATLRTWHRPRRSQPTLSDNIHDFHVLYMSTAEDRLTSIPVHATTVRLLQQLKTGSQNWDEFLLSAFEDLLPPEMVVELERREREERSRTYAVVERDHARRASRSRAG